MMMKKQSLNAVSLRLILVIAMIVMFIASAVLFWLIAGTMRNVAIDTNHTKKDAEVSANTIDNLGRIRETLETNKEVVDRTNRIVAESQSYQYQDQIIEDLNNYARNSGVSITNIDFADTAEASTPSEGEASAEPAINGVNSVAANITLNTPVDYVSLLRFLSSIEQNLTKMQVSKVNVAKAEGENEVTSEALTIQVYVR